MLMRFDPFRDLDRLTERLRGNATATMPMDAYRSGDIVTATFDVPGVEPGSIEVSLDDMVLTVSAERRIEPGEHAELLVTERPHGRTTRQVYLGDGIDVEHIEARYENGVLTLRMPVAARATPRRVPVSAASHKVELGRGTAA